MYDVTSENAVETFDFVVEGRAYSVPTRGSVPYERFQRLQRAIRDAAPEERSQISFDAMVELIEEYAPGSTVGLTVLQLAGLVKAYSTSGAGEDEPSVGES